LSICLVVALAFVASGCGSSTNTVSTTVTTSTPVAESPHTTDQATGSTQAPQASTPTATQPAKTKTLSIEPPTQLKPSAPKQPAAKPNTEPPPPVAKEKGFPRAVKVAFLEACGKTKGSPSGCKCVLATQEMRKVEKGQAIAEMLILEREMRGRGISIQQAARHAVLLPEGVELTVKRCLHA
jgi:hypothetical protein